MCYRLRRRITFPDVSEVVIFQPLPKMLVGLAGTPTPKELHFSHNSLSLQIQRKLHLPFLESLLLLASLISCRTPFYPLNQVILQLADRNGTEQALLLSHGLCTCTCKSLISVPCITDWHLLQRYLFVFYV